MYNIANGVINNGSFGENQFRDINNGNAPKNLTYYNVRGFKVSEFNATHSAAVTNVTNVAELEAALASMAAFGGTINLAAGTYNITTQLTIPSNIVLQGAGTLATFLKISGGHLGLVAKHKRNIVIRDMRLEGWSDSVYGVYLWYTQNVLIERCRFIAFQSEPVGYPVKVRHTSKLTIRFCGFDGGAADGLIIKDFDNNFSNTDLASTEYVSQSSQADGTGAPLYGSLISKNVIVHSCDFDYNLQYGASFYNNTVEFAGNQLKDNTFGLRLSNTQNSSIHDNYIQGEGHAHVYGILFENGYNMNDVLYSGLCVYNNKIHNATVGLKFLNTGGAFASNTSYTSVGTGIQWTPANVTLTTCSGSIESVTYSVTVNASDCATCIPVIGNGEATVSISVFNNGPEDADNVVLNFTITGIDVVGASTSAGTVSYTTSGAVATIGSIANNTSVTVNIALEGESGTYTGVGTLSTTSADSDLSNNSAILEISI